MVLAMQSGGVKDRLDSQNRWSSQRGDSRRSGHPPCRARRVATGRTSRLDPGREKSKSVGSRSPTRRNNRDKENIRPIEEVGWGRRGKGIVNGEAVEPSPKVTAQVLRGTSRYSLSLDSCSTLDNKVFRNDARSSVVSISTPFLYLTPIDRVLTFFISSRARSF